MSVEPLAVFLRRYVYVRESWQVPARPAWSPSLADYDRQVML